MGTWVALFWGGIGMNKQLFHFVRFEAELRGRCDNPYTMGTLEKIVISGNTLYFGIVYQDWGAPEATFDRQNAAWIVQNEMVVDADLDDIDPENPPAEPPAIEGFVYAMLGPIAPERTAGQFVRKCRRLAPRHWFIGGAPEGRELVEFGLP